MLRAFSLRKCLQPLSRNLQLCNVISNQKIGARLSSQYYPINDDLYGLTEEQKQLRRTVFNFAQKEIAPKAAQIDQDDEFVEMRQFWRQCGELGLFGITAPGVYGGSGGGRLPGTVSGDRGDHQS